ncbi:MAG: tRNA pseudouridine(13) synthase TruD [Candidatus Bathyarchaeia archaeon]|nr:tRNA pseudouridine(13) synthase TruD [Candidatus Bathyarchaeota archaeon]
MSEVPGIERSIGIEVYASRTEGIGGVIKRSPEDFIVEEILADGLKASVKLENNLTHVFADHGRYLICILIKRGWDTLLAVEEISKAIGIDSGRVGFAGIKDANALTAQYISVGGVPASKLADINIEGIVIKPLGYADEEVTPKRLLGNMFTIVVRSVRLVDEVIEDRIRRICSELDDFGGVPNFFGHQRFGTIRPITHLVGKSILKGDFESAVMTFLSYVSPFESAKASEVRRDLRESLDFKAALKKFPKTLFYERLILSHLSNAPRDYIGALHKLPQSFRKLFIQSYQSYLFNRFLSERIKRGIPLKEVQVGDYAVRLNSMGLPEKPFIEVKESNVAHVNKEIRMGRMALALPLIGLRQPPSKGLQGEIESEILEEEGISGEDFKRTKVLNVSVLGGLRVAMERVMNFEAKVIREIGRPLENSVEFKFILHKGAYATILLREFMKPRTDEELVKSGF